jgi:enoyl-CoA hydratase/carnithine racemase
MPSPKYAMLADVVIAADTTVFSDLPHLAFGIAPGDGLFVVWEEVLGLNRARRQPRLPPAGLGQPSGRHGRAALGREDAIYHVHAKDTALNHSVVRWAGVLDTTPQERVWDRAWNFRTVGGGQDALPRRPQRVR